MGFAISWSRLECHEQCALKSYYKNFAPKGVKIPFTDTPATKRGKLWHKWMEDALAHDKPLPEEVSKFKPMVDAIKRADGELLVEHQLCLTEKYQPCDWFSPKAYWRTIYDVLVKQAAGRAFSIDWKTGKIKDPTDQLKFSSAAAFVRWPDIQTIKTGYVWLDYPEAPPTMQTFERRELKPIMDEFEERVEMVKIAWEEQSWEAQPSDFNCKWCPCTKAQCEHARN